MKNVETLSPYKIWWIEFRAQKGIVTQKDARILKKYDFGGRNRRNLLEHFPSKDAAEKYLAEKAEDFKKLSKRYEVRICTDKQFGNGRVDMANNIVVIDFTTKQNEEMFVIG